MGTLEQALRVAAIMRQLREVDIADARRCRELGVAARSADLPGEIFDRYAERVHAHVAAARKWNRQLLLAQRQLRNVLHTRAAARYPFPGVGLVRQVRP